MQQTDYTPSRFGWIGLSDDISAPCENGGLVAPFTVGATALKLGDAVFISAAKTVDKAAATTNHAKVIGVVVGGSGLDAGELKVHQRAADIGTQAAPASGKVLVALFGIAYAVSDAAITAGDALVLGTSTAGRVKTATATTGSAANPTQATSTIVITDGAVSIGAGATPVTSTAANGAIGTQAQTTGVITNGAITAGAVTLAGDGFTKIFAKALETASGAAEKIRVLIHL